MATVIAKQVQRTKSDCTSAFGSPSTIYSSSFETDSTNVVKQETKLSPGWKKCRDNGAILPVNPYFVSRQDVFRSGCNGTALLSWNGSCLTREVVTTDVFYNLYKGDPPPLPDLSGDIAAAVNSAIADASQAKVQALVSAGEAKETFHLLLGAARRLLAIVKAVKLRSKEKKISFESAWLEYRYGWRPLIYEVKQWIDALNHSFEKGERVHGRGNHILTDRKSGSLSWAAGTEQTIKTDWSFEYSIRVNGFALCEVTNSTIARFGLNPLTSAYELITLSFVLNWFWDIGSWLAANSTSLSGFSLVSSGNNVKIDSYYYSTTRVVPSAGSHSTGGYYGQQYSVNTRSFQRAPGGGGGLPSWYPRLSPAKLADLAAILAQVLKAR